MRLSKEGHHSGVRHGIESESARNCGVFCTCVFGICMRRYLCLDIDMEELRHKAVVGSPIGM